MPGFVALEKAKNDPSKRSNAIQKPAETPQLKRSLARDRVGRIASEGFSGKFSFAD